MRTFETGATRDSDDGKIDPEGYLSPAVIYAYSEFMRRHSVQADGQLRASDNWQKGIPRDAYMKSMWRHFLEVWINHRCGVPDTEDLCALLFNVQGYLFEILEGR